MEYSTTAENSMKKPTEDSVQEMLDLVQRQQVQDDGEFRGRVFNPLPAIGTKRPGASHGALAGLAGENAVRPRLERESTVFDLRQGRSNNMATTMSTNSIDFKTAKVDHKVLKCKSKSKPSPRVPYALRRESTNYHLPPLSSFQIQDPRDIERPSAPSPISKELLCMAHNDEESELNVDWGSNNNYRPQSPELFDRNAAHGDSGYLHDSDNGGRERLSPWSATEAPSNEEWGLPEQEQSYERPKTARGSRRRGEREQMETSTPRSNTSSNVDTGSMPERPKTARGSRRVVDKDDIMCDARPRTRGRRREISEQDAYEPYERPKTAKGGRREQQEGVERPRTARGTRQRSEDEPPERQRTLRKPRPKSPGPHHPRYRMMNTNSRSSNNEFDENRIIENVAVMNSAT